MPKNNKILNAQGHVAEATPVIVTPTGEAASKPALPAVRLEAFDKDGYVMKFAEDPQEPTNFLLHNKEGVILGVCNRPDIANMLCEAMRLLFLAQVAAKAEREMKDVMPEFITG